MCRGHYSTVQYGAKEKDFTLCDLRDAEQTALRSGTYCSFACWLGSSSSSREPRWSTVACLSGANLRTLRRTLRRSDSESGEHGALSAPHRELHPINQCSLWVAHCAGPCVGKIDERRTTIILQRCMSRSCIPSASWEGPGATF